MGFRFGKESYKSIPLVTIGVLDLNLEKLQQKVEEETQDKVLSFTFESTLNYSVSPSGILSYEEIDNTIDLISSAVRTFESKTSDFATSYSEYMRNITSSPFEFDRYIFESPILLYKRLLFIESHDESLTSCAVESELQKAKINNIGRFRLDLLINYLNTKSQ